MLKARGPELRRICRAEARVLAKARNSRRLGRGCESLALDRVSGSARDEAS